MARVRQSQRVLRHGVARELEPLVLESGRRPPEQIKAQYNVAGQPEKPVEQKSLAEAGAYERYTIIA